MGECNFIVMCRLSLAKLWLRAENNWHCWRICTEHRADAKQSSIEFWMPNGSSFICSLGGVENTNWPPPAPKKNKKKKTYENRRCSPKYVSCFKWSYFSSILNLLGCGGMHAFIKFIYSSLIFFFFFIISFFLCVSNGLELSLVEFLALALHAYLLCICIIRPTEPWKATRAKGGDWVGGKI